MKKLLSFLLMVAMLVTCIAPALTSSAADVPSVVVAEKAEFDEMADTVTVTFSLQDNPGIAALNVWVYSDSTELELKKNDDVWSAGAGFDSEDNNFSSLRNYDHKDCAGLFAAAGVENAGSIKAGSFELLTANGNNSTENGVFLTVTFNLVGDHPAGTEYTYGMLIESAEDENGEEIAFASNHVAGVATAIVDPYTEVYKDFTVFTVCPQVQPGQTEVTVELRWTNNPGINAFRLFVIYDETLEMLTVEPSADVFDLADFEKDGAMNEPTTGEDANKSVLTAVEYIYGAGYKLEGKLASTVFCAKKTGEINVYKNGLLAYLTFKLPEGVVAGDKFPIDLIYTEKDLVHLDEVEKDEDGNAMMVFEHPDRPTCHIIVECGHEKTHEEHADATCAKEGYDRVVCDICGEFLVNEIIEKRPHTPGEEEKIPATCTEPGKIVVKCTVCGDTLKDETDPDAPEALEHLMGQWETTVPADCEKDGEEKRVCERCHEYEETRTIDAPGHDWNDDSWEVTTEPKCGVDGEETRVCGRNPEHKETRPVQALDHVPGEPVITPATCTEDGSKVTYCELCGAELSRETIDAFHHAWDDGETTKAPTCTEDGEKTYTCKNDPSHKKTEPIKATGHKWDDGDVTTPATCEEDGVRTYTCQNDPSHTKTEGIPAIGHKWVEVYRTSPNYTDPEYIVYICENDEEHVMFEEGAPALKAPVIDKANGAATISFPAASDAIGMIKDMITEMITSGDLTEEDLAEIAEELGLDPATATIDEILDAMIAEIYDSLAITIDGELVTEGYEIVIDEDGNVSVVLSEELLATLSNGKHTVALAIVIEGEDFIEVEEVPVKVKDSTPAGENPPTTDPAETERPADDGNKKPVSSQTGDAMVYIIIVALVAVIGCAAVIVVRRRSSAK